MSNTSTKWIIELIDKITSPAKKVTESVDEITQAVEDVTEAVQFNEKETKEALVNSKKYYDELANKVKEAEKEVAALGREAKKAAPGEAGEKVKQEFEQAKQKVERLREALQGAEDDIEHLTQRSKEFQQSQDNWAIVSTGVNQTIDMIDRLSNSLQFSNDIVSLRDEIQRLTDASGKDLDNLTTKAYRYSKIFKEEPYKIAQAVNAMTEMNGGSYDENFALIEKGFEKGADANKDMLDQLREYPGFFRELGLSNSEAIAVMAKAGKKGIFSDKAMDSLKEAQMSVTEMTQTQIDAIDAVGLKVKDFEGKTAFDAIRMVSEAMKGSSAQAKQQVLADIFKGAGEDASRAWVEGYASIDLDLDKIKSVETANKGLKSFIADVQLSIANVIGGAGEYVQVIGQVGQGALGTIGIYNTLNGILAANRAAMALTAVSTTGAAAAQGAATVSAFSLSGAIRAIGVSIMSIPVIGWILALIAALTALFAYFWNTSDEFRGFFYGVWEVIKLVFTKIVAFIRPILQFIWIIIKTAVTSIWNFWSMTFGYFYDKVVNLFKKISETIRNVLTSVKIFISNALNEVSNIFGGVFGGIYNSIVVIFDSIYDKIMGTIDKIKTVFQPLRDWWNEFKGEAKQAFEEGQKKAEDEKRIKEYMESDERKGYIDAMLEYDRNQEEKYQKTLRGNPPLLSFYNDGSEDSKSKPKGKKAGDKEGNMSISGSKGSTSITMTINNYFNSKGNTDVRYLAEAVASKIGDRLEDAVISIG